MNKGHRIGNSLARSAMVAWSICVLGPAVACLLGQDADLQLHRKAEGNQLVFTTRTPEELAPWLEASASCHGPWDVLAGMEPVELEDGWFEARVSLPAEAGWQFYRTMFVPAHSDVDVQRFAAPPEGGSSIANAISDSGVCCGYIDPGPQGRDTRAVIWDGSGMVDLGKIPSELQSWSRDINNNGVVVGLADIGDYSGYARYLAFVYADGQKSPLPRLNGGTSAYQGSEAYGINDANQIVGRCRTDTWGNYHAVLWTRSGSSWGNPTDVGSLTGAAWAGAYGISESGQFIVGYSDTGQNTPQQPIMWRNEAGSWKLIQVGTLAGKRGYLYAVNNQGEAVGSFGVTDTLYHAGHWSSSTGLVDLGTLGGKQSNATVITEDGCVYGAAQNAADVWRACMWKRIEGQWQVLDLNLVAQCPPGWIVSQAASVNSHGALAGAVQEGNGPNAACALMPVEP